MEYSMVSPKTCILKVNLHCSACERKVRNVLQKINGVYSVGIDGEQGKVTVSGTVDPRTLIIALGKAGKRAELMWEYCQQPVNNQHQSKQVSQRSPPQGIDSHLGTQMAQLQHLSKIERLKQVELTHSKSVRMTFSGHSDDLSCKNGTQSTKIVVDDNIHGPQVHHGGGTSGATAPCCGGCHHHATNTTHHGYHEVDARCCGGPSRASGVKHEYCNGCRPPPACRCTPPGPPPSCSNFVPGPPPESPPVAYPYPSIFGDDNPNGCNVM